MSRENRIRSGIALIRLGCDLDLADRADGAVPRGARRAARARESTRPPAARDRAGSPSALHPRGRRDRDGHVGVNVSGDRGHDSDPVPGVLQDAGLLDVHLDPAGEIVEHVDRLAPAAPARSRPPRRAPRSCDRRRSRGSDSRRSSSVTRWAMILLPSSIWPKPEPSSSRKEISCSGRPRPSSSFSRQTSSAVTTPIVPSYLPPLRFESQCEPMPNTFSPCGRLRATSVPTGSSVDVEPDRLQLAREVVERVAVHRRVGVAADRLVGES